VALAELKNDCSSHARENPGSGIGMVLRIARP
jgi:hypothetical protein